MTDIHAPARDEQSTTAFGPSTGSVEAPPVADVPDRSGGTSPFASYRPGDYVRDVVSALVLLLALALPWTSGARGADRVEVVLVTAVSLAALTLPYLARFSALPAAWTVQSTRKWRVWINLPFIAVALIHVMLDLFTGSGVGTGLGLGIGGALLAATPRDSELGPADLDGRVHDRWRTVLIAAGGLTALLAFISLVQTYFTDREPKPMLLAPIGFAAVIGILVLLVAATWRRDRAARLVLLAVGVVLTVLAVFTSGSALPGVESTHDQRFGMVLIPALAALAAAPAVRRSPFWESQGMARASEGAQAPVAVDIWIRVAIRAFEVLALLAVCCAAGGIVHLVTDGFGVNALLRLILGLVIAGVAAFARRSLLRDRSSGHVPAVGAACATAVLGLVVVVATSGSGYTVRLVDLVMAIGLPGTVAVALMVPKAVREHFDTTGLAGEGDTDRSQAWIWAPAANARPVALPAEPARERQQIPVGGGARQSTAEADPTSATTHESDTSAPAVEHGAATSTHEPLADQAPAARGRSAGHRPADPAAGDPSIVRPEQVSDRADDGGSRDATAVLATSAEDAAQRPSSDTTPSTPAEPATPDRPRKRVSSVGAVRTYAGQGQRTNSGEQASVAQAPTAREMRSVGPSVGDTAVMQPITGGAAPAQPAPPRGWSPEVALDPRTPLADLAVIVQEAPHLRPHVARNPSTYPALLDWLGALGDPDVDAALRSRR